MPLQSESATASSEACENENLGSANVAPARVHDAHPPFAAPNGWTLSCGRPYTTECQPADAAASTTDRRPPAAHSARHPKLAAVSCSVLLDGDLREPESLGQTAQRTPCAPHGPFHDTARRADGVPLAGCREGRG